MIPVSAARVPAVRYLSSLRLQEILVLQGSPLLGALCALPASSPQSLGRLIYLAAANLFLVAHIFLLNDWAGLSTDRIDPNKAGSVFTTRGVGRSEIGSLSIVLLGLSLILSSRLGERTFGLALAIVTVSALYSLPLFNWKGRPLLGTAAHLAGGALHFLMGYSLGSAVDSRGLAIAVFFGVTFAAGHLMQEVRDHQGDALNTIQTNAVIFGPRRAFAASLALFSLAYALLVGLALSRVLPRPVAAVAGLYPFQLHWSLKALREGLSYESVCRLQIRYRVLFAVIGLAMAAALYGAALR